MLSTANPSITQRLRALFGFKTMYDDSAIAYMPTVRVNDSVFYTAQTIVRSGTTGTIYTTEDDPKKQFYFTGYSISSTATTTIVGTSVLAATINGVAQTIVSLLSGGVATIDTFSSASFLSKDFFVPLPVDRNTNITLTNTNSAARVSIYGFYEKQL